MPKTKNSATEPVLRRQASHERSELLGRMSQDDTATLSRSSSGSKLSVPEIRARGRAFRKMKFEDIRLLRLSSLIWAIPVSVLLLCLTLLLISINDDNMPKVLDTHLRNGKFIQVNDGHSDIKMFVIDEPSTSTKPSPHPPIVLLHGLLTSSLMYRKVIPLLTSGGFRTITMDFPGLGLSDRPSEDVTLNFEYMADRVAQVLDTLSVTKCHLAVSDFSGPIAAELAIKHSHKIESITLTNSFLNTSDFYFPFPMSLMTMHPIQKHVFNLFANPLSAPFNWFLYRWALSDVVDYDTVKSYALTLHQKSGKNSFLNIINNFNFTEAYRDHLKTGLKSTGIPLNLLWSTVDIIPRSIHQAQYIKENFNTRHEIWIEGKHLIQEDKPYNFADSVVKFIKEQRS